MVVTVGAWDQSANFISTLDSKLVHSVYSHHDVVTCVATSEDNQWIVFGSRDSTLTSFELEQTWSDSVPPIRTRSLQTYSGHDDEVTAVAVNSDHGIIASASKDGTCAIHSLRSGEYVRGLFPLTGEVPHAFSIKMVDITVDGRILLYVERYAPEEYVLVLFSINGKILSQRTLPQKLNCVLQATNGKQIICVDSALTISFVSLDTLETLSQFGTTDTVFSIAKTKNEQNLVLGRYDGNLLVLSVN
ncbi:WD40 repeat-like protein [Gonapodya prolifera JEL478]|uniref:WD40 repeat-like protein n=1 Tax=Gonapodya prolifera (strain JEL478) TaxID=1344416 RepID=A0A139APJ8_GONPJ|nr:WD40 repeat-like protein [Gonapodya prolifera JEL478]|eukprot:KXS18666.1 WD40 repeat-like protein [Gonapodya prolifera JEL478]